METIEAIHENGILRPLQPLKLQEHQAVRLVVLTEDMEVLAASQKKALLDLAGVGRSGRADVSTEQIRISIVNNNSISVHLH